MTSGQENYREILKREFEARAGRNPGYSLRAFARHLGLSSARLSEIFSEKQGLSAQWASRIADKLGFSTIEKQIFCDLVEVQHGRNKLKKRQARTRLSLLPAQTQTLQLDAFQAVSDWHHFAITELAMTRSFKSDPAWIARKLGIPQNVVAIAIERLLRLELLRREADGSLKADPETVVTPDGVPSEAIKKFHTQILERASKAIYTQAVPERDFSAVMIPFDREQLPQAKALIKEFRRGFSKRLEPSNSKDSVYCLAVQFFQLDQNLEEK